MGKRKQWVSVLAGILAMIMILSVVVGVLPTMASAASPAELQSQINALKSEKKEQDKKLKELKSQLSDNLDDMEATVAQKDIIDQEIFMLYEQMANLNEQITAYGLLIADKQDELEAAQARLKELTEKHKARIRAIEEDGGISYWEVLFQAKSFTDLLGRFYMIQEIAAADKRRIDEMNVVSKEVAAAKEQLQAEKKELETSKEELEVAKQEQEVKRAEADALLAKLIESGEEYKKLVHEAEKESNDLAKELANKEAEYEEAIKPPPSSIAPPEGGGDWIVPCRYILLTSAWGYRPNPTGPGTEFHDGVDLANNTGTPIYASRSGYVHAAGWGTNLGNYVTLNHQDGFKSQYLHMTHYVVKTGQWVEQGQLIGYMGSTGRSTGPHLHFSIYYNGSSVNPAKYINIR